MQNLLSLRFDKINHKKKWPEQHEKLGNYSACGAIFAVAFRVRARKKRGDY